LGKRRPGRFGELGEALDHQRQRGFVERVADVDQAVARFAGKADAFRDAGQKRHQRRFQRIGQDIDRVVVAGRQFARQLPARF
jgi:hypothetical protein